MMEESLSVQIAIDKAVQVCKTQRALSARLGIHETTLAQVKAGRRGLTPEQVIVLANLIGYDPCRLLAIDAVEREKDADRRARLKEGFFQRATLGGGVACLLAATVLLGVSAEARANAASDGLAKLSIYTLSRIGRAARRLCRALANAGSARHSLGPARP